MLQVFTLPRHMVPFSRPIFLLFAGAANSFCLPNKACPLRLASAVYEHGTQISQQATILGFELFLLSAANATLLAKFCTIPESHIIPGFGSSAITLM